MAIRGFQIMEVNKKTQTLGPGGEEGFQIWKTVRSSENWSLKLAMKL